MSRFHDDPQTDALQQAIRAHLARESGAADRLLSTLQGPIQRDVERFLGPDSDLADDLVQESLLATLHYLERDVEFEGDLIRLAVSIARNRCRDLIRWRDRRPQADVELLADRLADPGRTIIDELEETERFEVLQQALDQISQECRDLLRALFLDERPTEEVRRRLGLGTVQGVYYRKSVCLRRLKTVFQGLLDGRSEPGDRWAKTRPEGGGGG